MPSQQPYQQLDVSGGVQTATSRFLRKKNEVIASKNAAFNIKIGSATRRLGYEQVGKTIEAGKEGLGANIYKYGSSNKIMVAINDSIDSAATIRYLDNGGYWTNLITDGAPNTRFKMFNFLDEMYVVGYSASHNTYYPTTNVDSTLTTSITRNVFGAPRARFIDEFQNGLILMNCEVNGVKYPDRFYVSAPAIGFTTRIQGDQGGLVQQLKVDSVRYIKAGMSFDIYSAGTNAKVVSALTIISVDKARNLITFVPVNITVKDNDELWPSGRKGKLSVNWNTDYPTPEDAEWKRIPPGIASNPAITAHGKNNNRKLIFTENSAWKFDGANLVNISETIGCIASETVKNVGGWTLWLHYTGVWGYNDSTGQLRLLSRAVENYIKAANQATINKASAVVVDRIYKLALGEISDLDSSTTSTSTSSTSTSSTSSSTSSTSTSSTSTSSTSTSQTFTTTSTSSTSTSSTSTSSTSTSLSTSTSSTSTSTSTSSTSTSTIASTKSVLRLIYDFDSNTWWPEFHKREFRFQFMHTMNGYTKPYFLDETGRLWRDETGNLDGVDTIPFEIQMGRNNQGTGFRKNYISCIVQTEKARGANIAVSLDGQQFRQVGQVTNDVQEIKMTGYAGRDIDFKITHNDPGDGPSFDGITTYWSFQENKSG